MRWKIRKEKGRPDHCHGALELDPDTNRITNIHGEVGLGINRAFHPAGKRCQQLTRTMRERHTLIEDAVILCSLAFSIVAPAWLWGMLGACESLFA